MEARLSALFENRVGKVEQEMRVEMERGESEGGDEGRDGEADEGRDES